MKHNNTKILRNGEHHKRFQTTDFFHEIWREREEPMRSSICVTIVRALYMCSALCTAPCQNLEP